MSVIIEDPKEKMEREKKECLELCDTINARSRQFKATIVSAVLSDLARRKQLDDVFGDIVINTIITILQDHLLFKQMIQQLVDYAKEKQPESGDLPSNDNAASNGESRQQV